MTELVNFVHLSKIKVQGTPLTQSYGVLPKWERFEIYLHFFTNYWHSSTTQSPYSFMKQSSA